MFEQVLGYPPRSVDFSVLCDLYVEDVATYIWDHMLGEPDEPTETQIVEAVREALKGDECA